jgi:cell division topological specificity factor MinE
VAAVEKIRKFFRKTSGKVARERLQEMLLADRLCCSPDTADRIRDEMERVLSKYLDQDLTDLKIQLDISRDTRRGKKHVKTIQIKGL